MAQIRSYILVAFFIVLIAAEATIAKGDGNGNGNGNSNKGNDNGHGNQGDHNGNDNRGDSNGNNNGGNKNGNGNKGNGNGNANGGDGNGTGKGKKNNNKNNEDFDEMEPQPTGEERARCKAKRQCYQKTLVCPAQCPKKKPSKNKTQKGCHVDCSSKWRKPNCNGYGSLCYDPRFIGGDGVMFYFHGAKGGNFAVVSDDDLQINAHFIGTRPQGRTRDFTWVQALSIMFDTHNLVIAAKKVSRWNDNVDALIVRWDGEAVAIPTDGEAEWRINGEEREVIVERTDDTNSIRVRVAGLVEMDIKVRPIGKQENMVHNYHLPDNDAFAHLETQFKFRKLSNLVEGILGKTYRPDYVSPVKIGVPVPMMGGEDKYQTPSLLSPNCKFCRFQQIQESASGIAAI